MSAGALPLSVVIPTRDTRELTLACLGSLFRDDLPLREILVVDDGSRDGTVEAIRSRFPSVLIVANERSVGFSASANRGLVRTSGDLLLLLNSDTEILPGACERLVEEFQDNPRLGIAGAKLENPDGSPQWSGGREPTLIWLFVLASGLAASLARVPGYRCLRRPSGSNPKQRVDWVTGAALGFRRSVWREVGPLDERFVLYGQDLDFCLRADARAWTVQIVEGFSVVHRLGGTVGRSSEGVSQGQHLGLLWTDLVRWAHQRRGERWARRAGWALRAGAGLRVLLRRAGLPLVAGDARAALRQDLAACRAGITALRELRSASRDADRHRRIGIFSSPYRCDEDRRARRARFPSPGGVDREVVSPRGRYGAAKERVR